MTNTLISVAIASTLLLTGCGIAAVNRVNQMSATEIASMSDNEMCRDESRVSAMRNSSVWQSSVNPAFYDEFRRRDLVCDHGDLVGRGDQARQARRQLEAIEAIKQTRDDALYDAMIVNGLQMMTGNQPRPALSPIRDCTVTHTGFQHNTIDCW